MSEPYTGQKTYLSIRANLRNDSPDDTRHNPAVIFPPQYRPILAEGVGPLATGKWGGSDSLAGRRRYGASKLCQIIMMYVIE